MAILRKSLPSCRSGAVLRATLLIPRELPPPCASRPSTTDRVLALARPTRRGAPAAPAPAQMCEPSPGADPSQCAFAGGTSPVPLLLLLNGLSPILAQTWGQRQEPGGCGRRYAVVLMRTPYGRRAELGQTAIAELGCVLAKAWHVRARVPGPDGPPSLLAPCMAVRAHAHKRVRPVMSVPKPRSQSPK
jgi:hypothetical protein